MIVYEYVQHAKHFKFHSVSISTAFDSRELVAANYFKFHSVSISTTFTCGVFLIGAFFKFHSVSISTRHLDVRDCHINQL